MRVFFRVLAAAVLIIGPLTAGAETALQRAERDNLVYVEPADPHMEAAFKKARATLPEFLALARAPRPTITSMAVKVPIPHANGFEYFWISPFTIKGERIVGRINNTPRDAKTVRYGQTISFEPSDVVDWLYREDGRTIGNFTSCAILKNEPAHEAEAFKQRFGLECEP
jgi:uncharacterized protein YegJ (DUF2314 family)